jgi:hypothetical protein
MKATQRHRALPRHSPHPPSRVAATTSCGNACDAGGKVRSRFSMTVIARWKRGL